MLSNPDLSLLRCSWNNLPEVVDLLVDKLREGEDVHCASALHNHVAEVGCAHLSPEYVVVVVVMMARKVIV